MATADTIATLRAAVTQLETDYQIDQAANAAARDAYDAEIADLTAQLDAPKPLERPTGSVQIAGTVVPYVPIESLGFGPGADPNRIVAAMTSPGVLTFPPGEFPFAAFSKGYVTGFDIPHGPTSGTNGMCWGIVGSGPGSLDRTAPGTYFTHRPMTSRLTSTTSITNSYMMKAADVNAIVLGQFRLCGAEQGHRFSGLSIYHARAACRLFDVAVDGWSGDANVPPGETPGFSFFDLKDGARRDHLVQRLECDGRRADGVAYGSAPFGGQDLNGSVWDDCYGHDATASQVGFFRCRNVTTNRLRTARNGTGSGTRSGQGINHEQTTGCVHNSPTLDVPRANGNTGTHISHSNYGGTSPFAPGTLTINNPTALIDGAPAELVAQSWPPYSAANTAAPVVIAGGKPAPFKWSAA